MDQNTQEDTGVMTKAPTFPTDRLLELLSSFSTLRSEGHVLVGQIRGSIHEMRKLRGQVQKHRQAYSSNRDQRVEASDLLRQQYGLTRREVEVAKLLADGKSNAAIAQALSISAHTARHHTQRVLSKLKVHSRAEAGAKLRR